MNTLQMYKQAEERNPDAVILVEIGLFYEALGAAAELVGAVLGKQTSKRMFGGQVVRCCAVPYHELDGTIAHLRNEGHPVVLLTIQERAGQGVIA